MNVRVNRILETRLSSDQEALEALSDLSSLVTDNTLQTRRNLRCRIEQRSVEINRSFLHSFQAVKNTLDTVCDDLDKMAESMQAMLSNMEESAALTHDLIAQTHTLQAEHERVQVYQQIAIAFLERFQLSPAEQAHLYGPIKDTSVVPELFRILDHIHAISDCRQLLRECGYETLAVDVAQQMTSHQDEALERIYRWTQHNCRNFSDHSDVGQLVVEALRRLQERPMLFKYVVEEYAIVRRGWLVNQFIEALTKGGPQGQPKPIEMHAHDSKRYLGDMFAWLHQSIPGEKENLSNLLKGCDKSEFADQLQTALAYIADGVCHPLKVRVETILNSEGDLIVLFALSNLLRFYQQIMKQVVTGGLLEQCLGDLQRSSEEIYLNALNNQVRAILQRTAGGSSSAGLEPPQRDLVPAPSIIRLLNLLKEILSVASMVDGRQADIVKIIATVMDPLLQSVQESASHLPTVDMAVYLLNCFYQMQTTLAVYEYVDERIERLQAQSEAQLDTLISEQASSLVTNLNLGPIYNILQSSQTKIEANLLQIFISKMEAFLRMPDMLLLPQTQLLHSSGHRTTVQKRAFQVIVAIYKQIYERVHDPANGFESPETVFAKTPEQVANILAIK